MALEKVLELEHNRIDNDAKKQKELASYLCRFANENYDKLIEIYDEEINNYLNEREGDGNSYLLSEKGALFESILFSNVRKVFRELNENISGIYCLTAKKPLETIDVKLGLVKYELADELDSERYEKRLTKKGEIELGQYRVILGLGDIREEQRKLFRNILL